MNAERLRNAALYGLVGIVSGTAAIGVWKIAKVVQVTKLVSTFTDLTVLPGFVFGLMIGFLIYRRRLVGIGAYAAYVAAALTTHWAAFNLAVNIYRGVVISFIFTGLIAGLFGAASLTALSAILLPVLRRVRVGLALSLTGCALGSFLWFMKFEAGNIWPFFLIYGAWQGGYAAALGFVLPARGEKGRQPESENRLPAAPATKGG